MDKTAKSIGSVYCPLRAPHRPDGFYAEGLECGKQLRNGLRTDQFLPAHCGGLSKARLATLSANAPFLQQRLPMLTPNSAPTRNELERQFKKFRQLGYTRTGTESEGGSGTVAAALLNKTNICGSLSGFSGPLIASRTSANHVLYPNSSCGTSIESSTSQQSTPSSPKLIFVLAGGANYLSEKNHGLFPPNKFAKQSAH